MMKVVYIVASENYAVQKMSTQPTTPLIPPGTKKTKYKRNSNIKIELNNDWARFPNKPIKKILGMGDRATCSENTIINKYNEQDVNGVVIYK